MLIIELYKIYKGNALTNREGGAHVGDLEGVKDDRRQIALGLGGAVERREAALLEDAAEGLGARGPGAALLLQAQIIERRFDRHDNVALEGRVLLDNIVVVAFGERSLLGRLGNVDHGGRRNGGNGGGGGSIVLTNRHCYFDKKRVALSTLFVLMNTHMTRALLSSKQASMYHQTRMYTLSHIFTHFPILLRL